MAAEVVFSPHSQNTLPLWEQLDLSNGEGDDVFSDEEKEDKHQAPLPTASKRPRDGLDDERSPSKKTKVDISDLFGMAMKADKGKGNSVPPPKSKSRKHRSQRRLKRTKRRKIRRTKRTKRKSQTKRNPIRKLKNQLRTRRLKRKWS